MPLGFGKRLPATRNPSDPDDFLVKPFRELYQHFIRGSVLRVDGQAGEHEVHQRATQVLGPDLQVSALPSNDDRRTWGFNDLCGPAPAALVFGRGRPVEVHQVALIQLKLLSCQPSLGRKSALKSQLSGLCDHRPNGDLPNPEVMSGVARNTARRVVKLSLAGGLELSEAWRVAASLENLPPARKQELGEQLIEAWKQGHAPRCAGWALGRIGARIPIYGTLDNQLSPAVVSTWIETLTRSDDDDDKALPESLIAALVQMARLTGDRTLDIDETLRGKVSYRLRKSGADARYLRPLNEAVALEAREHSTALGDSLPVGLRIGG